MIKRVKSVFPDLQIIGGNGKKKFYSQLKLLCSMSIVFRLFQVFPVFVLLSIIFFESNNCGYLIVIQRNFIHLHQISLKWLSLLRLYIHINIICKTLRWLHWFRYTPSHYYGCLYIFRSVLQAHNRYSDPVVSQCNS